MLEQLIERISLLDDKSDSEENLKFHVTVWLLKELGYEERMFNFEHPICRDSKKNKHADIFIPVKPGKAMFVETKKYSKSLFSIFTNEKNGDIIKEETGGEQNEESISKRYNKRAI